MYISTYYYCINETGISNVEKCQTIDELKQCVFGAMAKLEKESPYFKNSSFAEEKEWRIVITYVMDHFAGADLSGFNTDDYKFGKLDYIVSNNKLVSHFEIKFPNINLALGSNFRSLFLCLLRRNFRGLTIGFVVPRFYLYFKYSINFFAAIERALWLR